MSLLKPVILFPVEGSRDVGTGIRIRGKATPGTTILVYETGRSDQPIGTPATTDAKGNFYVDNFTFRGRNGEHNSIAVRAFRDNEESAFSDNVGWTT